MAPRGCQDDAKMSQDSAQMTPPASNLCPRIKKANSQSTELGEADIHDDNDDDYMKMRMTIFMRTMMMTTMGRRKMITLMN